MSVELDREWADLARDWQGDTQLPAAPIDIPRDIRRKVQRFSWGLVALTVFELTFLGLALAFLTLRAWQQPHPLEITTAIAVWALSVVAMGFTLWNRRGTWRPEAETARAFLKLSHKRCVRKLIGVRYAWRILAVEIVLFVPWIAWVIDSKPAKKAQAPGIYFVSYGYLVGILLLTALFLHWYSRRTRRELAAMETMLAEAKDQEMVA